MQFSIETLYYYFSINGIFNAQCSNFLYHSGRLHAITAQDELPVDIVLVKTRLGTFPHCWGFVLGWKARKTKTGWSSAHMWLVDNIEVVPRHCGNGNLARSWE